MAIFKNEENSGPVRGPSTPVEATKVASNNPPVAVSVPAKVTVAKHGGLAGGKARDDGLVPGSADAAEADRKKDAERKRTERAERAAALAPKPLPGQIGNVQGSTIQANSSSAAGAGAVDRPRVPWTVQMLRPLSNQGIKVGELAYVGKISKRATEINLPGQLIKETRNDAEELCKQVRALFEIAVPQVTAKWLNKTGLSPENAPEVALVTAIGAFLYGHFALCKKMDDFAEKVKARSAGPGVAAVWLLTDQVGCKARPQDQNQSSSGPAPRRSSDLRLSRTHSSGKSVP